MNEIAAKHRISYVTLQTTREGQGGYAHVHGIVDGLVGAGWQCELLDPRVDLGPGMRSAPRKALQWLSIWLRLVKRLRGTDIVYMRDHPAALFLLHTCRIAGVPTVLEINGGFGELASQYAFLRHMRGVLGRLARARVRSASGVVCVTRGLADWADEQGARRPAVVIPNGADVDVFAPGAALRLEVRTPCVVFVGSLAPWHGIPTLLEAARSPQWPRQTHLVIAGCGHDEGLVTAAAAELEHVHYLGRVAHEDVPGLVGASLAAVSPQTRRAGYTAGSPVKIYEALACGVPVIASDYTEVAQAIIDHRVGLVFPADDAESLAHCVATLTSDPGAAATMGAGARRLAVTELSSTARAQTTAAFLIEVMENRPSTSASTTGA